MILITGDTHGLVDYNKINILYKNNILTKEDYLIIAGDFGAIWNINSLDNDLSYYAKLPCTILFVDGNHENFDIINSFPISKWNGGKVHIIKDNIIHLMRGQIFTIEEKTIFTFGGATSVDKAYRTEHISWWKEEIPSEEEIIEGILNLERYNNKVDYVITHSIDTESLNNPGLFYEGKKCKIYDDNKILDIFAEKIEYKHWYFGHYHKDVKINDKKTALYNMVYELS